MLRHQLARNSIAVDAVVTGHQAPTGQSPDVGIVYTAELLAPSQPFDLYSIYREEPGPSDCLQPAPRAAIYGRRAALKCSAVQKIPEPRSCIASCPADVMRDKPCPTLLVLLF